MKKGALLTTKILDSHGKIGPFFFKEFIFVFLGCTSLFFAVLLFSLFMPVPGILLIGLPAAFLLLISLVRLLVIKKIDSPWYIHQWIARRFIRPRHIIANTRSSQSTLCFLQSPT